MRSIHFSNKALAKGFILYVNSSVTLDATCVERICKMPFLPVMQKGTLNAAHPDRHDKITKETVSLDGASVTRVTFGVGASWSHDGAHRPEIRLDHLGEGTTA